MMKKISLDLDRLAVESFPTTDATRAEEGTVHGHDGPTQGGSDCQRTPCCPYTYAPSCAATCTCP